MRNLLLLAVMSALVACKPASGPERRNVAAGNYTAAVVRLSASEREGVFLRAILDAGKSCQKIIRSEAVEPAGQVPEWRVTCAGGEQHLLSVKPDGTALVVSRTGF